MNIEKATSFLYRAALVMLPIFIPDRMHVLWNLRLRKKYKQLVVPGMPRTIYMRLTEACNLRCKMCGIWGDSGFLKRDEHKQEALRGEMGLDDWIRVLDFAKRYNSLVILIGGEPLLYKDIDDVLINIGSKKIKSQIITNGTMLEKHADRIIECGIDFVAVSIDGIEDQHDKVRGKGSFIKTMNGMRELLAMRKKSGKKRPFVAVNCVLGQYNHDGIEDAYEMCRKEGVDVFNLSLPFYIPEERFSEYEKIMREHYDMHKHTWKGFRLNGARNIDLDKVKKGIKKIRKKGWADGTLGYLYPNIPLKCLGGYFNNYDNIFGIKRCFVPWMELSISSNGDVFFCPDFPDYIIGNIKDLSLDDIWRSERAVSFRKRLSKGLMPICNRCCGLYYYNRQ